jgi:hypothetical protein
MAKLQYALDPYNRLVLDQKGTRSDLSKFRKVIDGRFKIGPKNVLIYHIKAPLAKKEKLPHQLKLKGKWALTGNYDLSLTLDKKGRKTLGDKLTLKGNIIDVKENALLFAVTTKTEQNRRLTYVLQLGGSWKADKYNRLNFHIKREKSKHDILTFKGAWDVNKSHQLIYTYEKAHLLRKKKELHTLTFRGYWKVTDKSRISYEFSKRSDSVFEFRTRASVFTGNRIKYELGIGVSGRTRPFKRAVTLSGRWKIVNNLGLAFEVKYRGKKPYYMVFGADAALTDKDTISFRLRNDIDNKAIGTELKLSRKLLKGDGEAFLRLLKSSPETAVYLGAGFRF